MFPLFCRPIRRTPTLAHLLMKDFENTFHRGVKNYNHYYRTHQTPKAEDNGYYRMEYTVNNNGHVQVQTLVKEPGKPWNVLVEEYNKDHASSIEQNKPQKKAEAIGQGKTNNTQSNTEANRVDKTATPKQTEAAPKGTSNPEVNTKDSTVKSTETNSMKDKVANVSEATPKTENAQNQKGKPESNGQSPDLSRRGGSRYDELQTIFEDMERDFESKLKRHFDSMSPNYNNRRMRKDDHEHHRDHHRHSPRRYYSPFDEMESMFDRHFGSNFKRDFDFFDRGHHNNSRGRQEARNEREVIRKDDRHFDEFDAIFDSFKKDYEQKFRRRFDEFENTYRRGVGEQNRGGNRRGEPETSQGKGSETQKAQGINKANN
jgi:hypothetical protein